MPTQTVNGVKNFYGPRDRHPGSAGSLKTEGGSKEAVFTFTGETLTSVAFTLPAGAIVRNSFVEVTEVFVLGGTTPVINIGVSGSSATNFVLALSQANAQALGTYAGTQGGTLAANTPTAAANSLVGALSGTTPTIGLGGQAKVVVRYDVL